MRKYLFPLLLWMMIMAPLAAKTVKSEKDLLWAQLDSSLENRTPETAQKLITKLQSIIYKEKKSDECAKLLIYRMRFAQMNEEKYLPDFIQQMETELKTSWIPYTNLLHSMIAESYKNFYNQNRYRYYKRNNQVGSEAQTIETLTKVQLYDTIQYHINASLENSDMLLKEPLTNWNAMVEKGTKPSDLRSNSYDFLLWRGVDIFKDCSDLVDMPQYLFNNSTKELYADNKEFASYVITSNDANNNNYLALKLIQEGTATYLKTNNTNKLSDIELNRILLLKELNSDNSQEYPNALERIAKSYEALPISALANYHLASYYSDQEDGKSILKALNYAQKAIDKYPKSEGGLNSLALIESINAKSCQVTMESIYPSAQKIVGQIEFKNISKIYARLYDVNKLNDELRIDHDSILKYGRQIRAFEIKLRIHNDHQQHTEEFETDSLKTGKYLLLTSLRDDFKNQENITTRTSFTVSNLLIIKDLEDKERQFIVLHRQTGKPIVGAKGTVTCYTEYNFRGESTTFNLTSNEKGELYAGDKLANSVSYKIRISHLVEVLEEEENYRYNYREQPIIKETRDFIFTDRKIYRPNQPIYYKVVRFITDGTEAKAQHKQPITVELHDTNGKLISSQTATTNEFGSVSGEFMIPASVLNGDWRITTAEGASVFQVEEYVRPKFEVEFSSITELLLAGDTATISGVAKSYSQLSMNGCKVKYQILNSNHFEPYYYRPRAESESALVSDTTTTNELGEFKFKFAIPKELKDASYKISVQITSSVGETINKESSLTVRGSVATTFVQLRDKYQVSEIDAPIVLESTNTNGTTVKLPISYAIYSLKTDFTPIPKKLWEDNIVSPTMKYGKMILPIPNNRPELDLLAIDKLVAIGELNSDSTVISKTILNGLNAGVYRIITNTNVTKGDSIKTSSNFIIESFADKKLELPSFLYNNLKSQKYLGGDTLQFNLGSSLQNGTLFYQILWNNGKSTNGFIKSDNNKQIVKAIIPKDYEGAIEVNCFLVDQNRLYYNNISTQVESPNKTLDLKLVTFRDLITPNSKESWKLLVTQNGVPSKKSEIVTTMYDASLDAFVPNIYNSFYGLFRQKYIHNRAWPQGGETTTVGWGDNSYYTKYQWFTLEYPSLRWFEFSHYGYYTEKRSCVTGAVSLVKAAKGNSDFATPVLIADNDVEEKLSVGSVSFDKGIDDVTAPPVTEESVLKPKLELRRNFQETAFFMPHLTTDTAGVTTIEFTAPQTITTWKLMAFAHTTDGKSGSLTYKTTTQKELMIQPNLPRFLYQDDRLELKATISKTGKDIESCQAIISITDEFGKPLTNVLKSDSIQLLTFGANSSATASWSVDLTGINKAIVIKTVAISKNHTDGEQRYLPVIPNKQRVVESLPFYALNKGVKKIEFAKLKENAGKVENRKLTLNYTQNASWEVVKALPYLLESSDENSDALLNRYYANALAFNIIDKNSNIANTLERWSKEPSQKALTSPLQSNEESKLIALDQTPWLNEGQDESQARQRLVTLLNRTKIETDQANTLSKLLANQQANGGWPWFRGMETSLQLSQYITKGILEMRNSNLDARLNESPYSEMVNSAINYCDNAMIESYNRAIEEHKKMKDSTYVPTPSIADMEYLSARHLEANVHLTSELEKIEKIYFSTVATKWTSYSPEYQATIAIWSFRSGQTLHTKIMESIYQCAIKSTEMGNYYKREANDNFFRGKIEQHGVILNAFAEIGGYEEHVKLMQLYLIQQKRTNKWENNKETTMAIKSLLVNESKWLDQSSESDIISIGDKKVKSRSFEPLSESWSGTEINKSLAAIKIDKKSSTPSWGSLEWDYFANVTEITANSQNPLTVNREYFKVVEKIGSPSYEAITDQSTIKVGDKVMIRLTVKTDRPMEFVHLKDNRAAAFEPMEIFSGYNYNGGVGYYQNIKDVSSNFYIYYLPKGVWRVEYTVRVSQVGSFQSGIGAVQCYYAPEFQNQTKGNRFEVK
ncbi:MAG: hypothetical protein KBG80_03030 [Breznakibacter sp.]|nr:hypothetical protein [Breznakibacter sp.]